MRVLVLSLATVVALALPGVAAAKEVQSVTVCGTAGCKTLTGRNTDSDSLILFAEGGAEQLGPAAPSPYYSVDVVVDAEGQKQSWRVYYIPAAGTLVGTSEIGTVHWMRVPVRSEQAFADAIRGLAPFPKPELTRATVGEETVAGDPSSYLRLYEVATQGSAIPQDGDWIPIELISAEPSPWTTGDNYLVYSPSGKLLQRGGEIIRLPDAIASDVEHATAIGADGRSLLPWLVLGGVLAALLALAGLGALARRRWSGPATSPKAVSA